MISSPRPAQENMLEVVKSCSFTRLCTWWKDHARPAGFIEKSGLTQTSTGFCLLELGSIGDYGGGKCRGDVGS